MIGSQAQSHSALAPQRRNLLIAAFAAAALAPGCNDSSTQVGGNNEPNSIVFKPDGSAFIADPNNLGLSPEPRIREVFWGRRVDVFGLDGTGDRRLMQEDFLIGASLTSSPGTLLVETNQVTGGEVMLIQRDVTDLTPGGGRDQFFDILRDTERNLAPVSDQGLGGSGIFTMVPRNATIVVIFDDLLDPNLISVETVQPRVGVPPTDTYDARVFADPNHGDIVDEGGGQVFYPTRVYIDPTITELEAAADGQALAVNTAGFPPSLDANLSNVAVWIPTVTNPQIGQTVVLENRSGNPLTTQQNGSFDPNQSTVPIVRAVRSGGDQAVTGDPFNGFLPDDIPPEVVGSLPGFITMAPVQGPMDDPDEFTLPEFDFATDVCSQRPVVGDIIEQPGIFAEVIEDGAPPDGSGRISDVRVRLLAFPPSFSSPADWISTAVGSATFLSTWDPLDDAGDQGCFVSVAPAPLTAPVTGIRTDSRFTIQFGEPMSRDAFSAFDSFQLSRENGTPVVGEIGSTLDLLRFTHTPNIPLAHELGVAELYTLQVDSSKAPPTDLAGNALAIPLPPVTLELDPNSNSERNGNRVTRFDAVDELDPIGDEALGEPPLPEFGGQHFYDLSRGLIRPRPVTRFEAVADRTQRVGSFMTPALFGSKTPLSAFGSKLQSFWRPTDLDLSYHDQAQFNLDVEGLNWAPFQNLVSTDRFDLFEIRLAHGKFNPDEYVCPGPPTIINFTSGVVGRFQDNLLSLIEDPLTVVHPRFRGFQITPGDIFTSSTGTRLVPFPMNEDVAPEDRLYYTWRDTAIRARGGQPGSIAPPIIHYRGTEFTFAGCVPDDLSSEPALWNGENHQSVTLPLLMEFRCFPDDGSFATNIFDVSVSQAIGPPALGPFFRAHSTGGVGPNGAFEVDPDLESVANGGFNPNSLPANQPVSGTDTQTYVGSIDFVVRVSRSYSVWWLADDEAGDAFPSPKYNEPVLEPRPENQPDGTSVNIAFRGATQITNFGTAPETRSALEVDSYGDRYNQQVHDAVEANGRITFLSGDDTWRELAVGAENPTGIDTAQYYQLRITFEANPISGLVPVLSALGITWEE